MSESDEQNGDPGRPSSARDAMEGEGSRPTPVRLAMDAERQTPDPVDLPSRTFSTGGEEDEEWIVRVEGRAETGGVHDRGAPLLFLTFARSGEPEERVLEAIRVGRHLADLSEGALREALAAARPFEGRDWERSPLFPGTRTRRGG